MIKSNENRHLCAIPGCEFTVSAEYDICWQETGEHCEAEKQLMANAQQTTARQHFLNTVTDSVTLWQGSENTRLVGLEATEQFTRDGGS